MNEELHERVAGLLSAYIDDEVTADERLLVERHLVDCARCTQELETLRQTVSWLRAMPPVAVPRPLTLRMEDVGLSPAEPPRRRSWWQAVAAPVWVGAAAALACVLLVGGGLLLNRAAPVQIAHQPQTAVTAAAAEKTAAPAPLAMEESAAEPEMAVAESDASVANEAELTASTWDETSLAEDEEAEFAAAAVPAEDAVGGAGAPEPGQSDSEGDSAAGESGASEAADLAEMTATSPPVATPTMQLAPMEEEALTVEDRGMAEGTEAKDLPASAPLPAETLLLEVSNLRLQIEPGKIVFTGTLPLAQGVRLSASLWRDGQPVEWATAESSESVVGEYGVFSLQLEALPESPDLDLFAASPATYEIRLVSEGSDIPIEARIPFDTFVPAAP